MEQHVFQRGLPDHPAPHLLCRWKKGVRHSNLANEFARFHKRKLGKFPFPAFWGPAAGIASSQWIAGAAKWFEEEFSPNLNLVYLPHLDYNLQRLGPDDPQIAGDLKEIDDVVADLVPFLEKRGVQVVLLSEYGITQVNRPVHINRVFREKGWLSWRDELGKEQIDLGNCQAFAVPDHQLAHIYTSMTQRLLIR